VHRQRVVLLIRGAPDSPRAAPVSWVHSMSFVLLLSLHRDHRDLTRSHGYSLKLSSYTLVAEPQWFTTVSVLAAAPGVVIDRQTDTDGRMTPPQTAVKGTAVSVA